MEQFPSENETKLPDTEPVQGQEETAEIPVQPAENAQNENNLFTEQDFSADRSPVQPNNGFCGYQPPYGAPPPQMGYQQFYNPYGYYGQPPVQPMSANQNDSVYRAMYSNPSRQDTYNMGQPSYGVPNPAMNVPGGQMGNPSPAHQTPPPVPPAFPDADAAAELPEQRKTGKGWVIFIIVLIVLSVSAVMILLALSEKDGGDPLSDGSLSGSSQSAQPKVEVNIAVNSKPQIADYYYADKEAGLLTTEGAAECAMPSIVSLYAYESTVIAASGEASGIIISEEGYILTNAHAVVDKTRVKVRLNDEREFEANIIGIDSRTDIAVLKIEADGLVPAELGTANDMRQGEQVVAIGNASGYNNSVSVGYVSYVNREINSYTGYPITCIQTDAVLNFGNSGGALVNMYGQVVGMVTSKYDVNGSEKIGFAITSDFFKTIAEGIISEGYVVGRPKIGITYRFISPEAAAELNVKPGLLVATVAEDCDISSTDLRPDDIITELDGIPMITADSVKDFQNTHKAGDTITARVYRRTIDNVESEFEITFKLMQDTNVS
ncbi:MAG: S1C family serine protease [Huintestinicola sp.]